MGFAISPENFRRAADMRCAIDRLCGPSALASFGVDERNTVDLKERFGFFDEFCAAGLRLRKRLHGLVRGNRRSVGILLLFRGP